MKKFNFMFFDKQMKELFAILDHNKDGKIDLKDWRQTFPEEIVCSTLRQIKDVIFRRNLRSEDVIKRMGIH